MTHKELMQKIERTKLNERIQFIKGPDICVGDKNLFFIRNKYWNCVQDHFSDDESKCDIPYIKRLKLFIFYWFFRNVNGKIDKNHLQDVMSNVKRKICHEDHRFITEKEITFAAILLMNILFSADNKTYYTV